MTFWSHGNPSLIPRPKRGRRKWLFLLLFVHALIHFGGIPLASWMLYLCLYTCDVKTNAKLYIVHTVTIVSENKNIVMRGLDHMLSPMLSSG